MTSVRVVDPGLIYRGAVAPAAGLAAATCARHRDAVNLLSLGLSTHQAHGSQWMALRSRQALTRM